MSPALSPKENLLRVIRHEAPEWVPYDMESVVWLTPPVVERPASAGLDAWGVRHALEKGAEGGTYPAPEGYTIVDLERWRDQITVPDVDAMDWDSVAAQARAIDRDQHLVQGFVEFGLFERTCLLLGMDNALTAFLTQPLEVEALIAAIADYKIRLIERFHEAARLIWSGTAMIGEPRQISSCPPRSGVPRSNRTPSGYTPA